MVRRRRSQGVSSKADMSANTTGQFDKDPVQTDVSFFIPERPPIAGQPPEPPLSRANALSYFAQSQFYERTCLNEELKMQQFSLSSHDMDDKLRRLPGIVYMLDDSRTHEEPDHRLYVIRKVRRAKGAGPPESREVTLRYYYILDRVVFEAPTLAAVIRARMLNLSWHLREAWHLCEKSQADSADAKSNRRAGESGGALADDSKSSGASSKKRAREEPSER